MSQNIGALLKQKRNELGLSLDTISSSIKVRSKYLELLEDDVGEHDAPEAVYMLGYLKLYANFLGLNGNEIVNNISLHAKELDSQEMKIPNNNSNPTITTIIVSFICLIVLLLIWLYHYK